MTYSPTVTKRLVNLSSVNPSILGRFYNYIIVPPQKDFFLYQEKNNEN